jgi:ketosteroid isomerase-like protein
MSDANLALIRRLNEAFNRGDFDSLEEFFHEDVEFQDLESGPDMQESVVGIPALQKILRQWLDVFDDFEGELEEASEVGDDHVLCAVTYRGLGKESGLSVETRVIDLHTFRGGKIARMVSGFRSREAALATIAASRAEPRP